MVQRTPGEVWQCARCGRTTDIEEPGSDYGAWELIEDPDKPDPEDWPVVCPGCLTNGEIGRVVDDMVITGMEAHFDDGH